MKIKISNCIQFFIFILLFMDVPYVKHVIGSNDSIYMIVETIIIALLAFVYYRHPVISVPIWILLFFGVFMLLTSLINDSGVGKYCLNFLPIILICLYFNLVQGEDRVSRNVLRTWIIFLTLLVVIDIVTIVRYPNGLYLGSSIYRAGRQRNWFLGYKTNRLLYSFPLVVFYSYYLFLGNKFRIRDLLLYVVVFLDIYLTNATAGSYMLILFLIVAVIYITSLHRKKRLAYLIAGILSKYYLFLGLFVFITVSVTLLQSNVVFVRFFSTFFGKSDTLTNRTSIWLLCTRDLKEHFVIGHGIMNASQYAQITGGYVNPHNTVLTYLLTGGIIGLLFVLFYFLYCVRNVKRSEENMLFLLAVYCLLILGITSSTLAYSPFLFVFMLLMYDNRSGRRSRYPSRGYRNEADT